MFCGSSNDLLCGEVMPCLSGYYILCLCCWLHIVDDAKHYSNHLEARRIDRYVSVEIGERSDELSI
jgi:hypothetical protein